jgi:thiamine-monophosphate kinase
MISEFDLIKRYFKRPVDRAFVGGGDDCALFSVAPGMQIATSTDLLLEGRHFFSEVDPFTLGHKALAVNLSDLAAMGATPIGCLLGLGLPNISEHWVSRFAEGFYTIAETYNCPLLGGDTTRSLTDITLSVTVFGVVPEGRALRRGGACAGDDIWVSGQLGQADVACRMLQGELARDEVLLAQTRTALEMPTPRLELGQALLTLAHSAIDVSDGLLQDLGHILTESNKGATLFEQHLPLHPNLCCLPLNVRRQAAFAGGDLYELCFTAAAAQRDAITQLARELRLPLSKIGSITQQAGLVVYGEDGAKLDCLPDSYDHFKGHE